MKSLLFKQPKIITKIADFRSYRRHLVSSGLSHGFVPTMGCLHEGHLLLVKKAKEICDSVSVSIFVNPSQFAPTEDLDKYPRTLDSDINLLKSVGADIVFVPTVSEMYPSGITLDVSSQKGAFVSVQGLSHQLEGGPRPHHFRGVATVVTKLFNIIQPDKAFFGQKDIQQCVVLKTMTRDLLFPIDLIVVETARDYDGLALSSRNRYLSKEERQIAPILYRALQLSKSAFEQGALNRVDIVGPGKALLENEKRISIDYYALSDPLTLNEIEKIDLNTGGILSATIRVGNTRLLDNVLLGYKI